VRKTLTFLTLLTAVHAAVVKPELPQWSEEDRKAVTAHTLVPGWDLLGTESGTKPGPAEVPPPTAAEMTGDSARSREVPERFLEHYFGSKPQSYLVDPQGLLDPHAAKDREGFLRYHADDSKIDLYVYLFGPDQEIPGSVRSEEITERFFSEGKPAVVVYYFLGAPDRSEIRVSPLLSDSVSGAEQRRALSTSLAQALEKKDPTAQFEAFCVQMSIRLYWMERVAGLVATPADTVAVENRPRALEEDPHSELKDKLKGYATRWALPFGIVAGAALLLGGGMWVRQLRRRYRFPDFEIPARLGGSHGAGIGAVISFGSAGQSPSSQRQEVPDYLGL
jgi:hypothetical protein